MSDLRNQTWSKKNSIWLFLAAFIGSLAFPASILAQQRAAISPVGSSCIQDAPRPTSTPGPDNSDLHEVLVGVYRPLLAHCNRSAGLATIECEDGSEGCIEKHGTYERDKYYFAEPLFDDDGVPESIRMISDGTLDLILTVDNSNPKRFTAKIEGSDQLLEILIDGPKCQLQPECFQVSSAPAGFSLGNGAYQQTKPLLPKKVDQRWGSVFKAGPANFMKGLRCYDVRTLSEYDLDGARGHCRTKTGWFVLPENDGKRFEIVASATGGSIGVPYGLKAAIRNQGWGQKRTKMMENEKEVNDNRSSSLGWKTGINLIVVNTEVHHNETSTSRRQNLYKDEVTYSEFRNVQAEWALVMDRQNMTLTDEFMRSVRSLIDTKDYEEFVITWGTHVPYATTFGKRSLQRSTYTKEHLQTLAEDGVSVSTGASAGISIPIPELGGSASASFGLDDAKAEDHAKRLAGVLGNSFEMYSCIGGSTCNGIASGAEVEPIYLDLMPTSELIGPPFLLFSYPAKRTKAERDLFKGVTQDQLLEVRDSLRNYIAQEAFLTGPEGELRTDPVGEYLRVGRVTRKAGSCTITSFEGGTKVFTAYDGGDANCRISNLTVEYEDARGKKHGRKPIGPARSVVVPRPEFASNQKPQYRNTNFVIRADISIKPTALCGGTGANDATGVGWGSWSVNVRSGSYEDQLKIEGVINGKDSKCSLQVLFNAKVDVGNAALMLDAD